MKFLNVNDLLGKNIKISRDCLDLSNLDYLLQNLKIERVNPHESLNTGCTSCLCFWQKEAGKFQIFGVGFYDGRMYSQKLFGEDDNDLSFSSDSSGGANKVVITNNKAWGVYIVCLKMD